MIGKMISKMINDFIVHKLFQYFENMIEEKNGSVVFNAGFVTRFKNRDYDMNFPFGWNFPLVRLNEKRY